jgi:hypothetical protein
MLLRDKDAAATLLLCEIAAQAKASTVYKELVKLYVDNGFYKEHLFPLLKGMEGLQQINQMMIELRENPLKEINGERVIMVEDYQSSIAKNLLDGQSLK